MLILLKHGQKNFSRFILPIRKVEKIVSKLELPRPTA